MANGDRNRKGPQGVIGRTERPEALIPELDNELLGLLDEQFQRIEQQQLERTLGGLEERGFFRSGQTLKDVSEQVLGPSEQRRRQPLLQLERESALRGREERLGEEQFERTRQLAQEDFQRRLTFFEKQARLQRDLIELQASLEGGGGFGFGELAGTVAGGVAGGFGAGFAGKVAGGS